MNLESDYVSWDEFRTLKAALEAKDAEIERLRALVSSSEAERYAKCGELLARAEAKDAEIESAKKCCDSYAEENQRPSDKLTVSEARTYLQSDAEMERRALAAEAALKEAREVLRPFAEAAENIDYDVRDSAIMWESPAAMALEAKHFRAARALLSKQDSGERP